MPKKMRVFVSSTMEDLANERAAAVEAIKRLNFEPVNAEGILPTGGNSWDILEPEIHSSDICILIQGDRYGWIPADGYGAGQGKSVTHLEIEVARRHKIPILPFFKKLRYGTDSTSPDAVLRDKFRKEISDWKNGLYRGEFNLALDLGDKVFQALLDVLTGSYLRTAVQARVDRTAALPLNALNFGSPTPRHTLAKASTPQEVLFAGAGLSLSAGLPSANALAAILGRAVGLDPSLSSSHSLTQLFEVAVATQGRDRVLKIVGELLSPPWSVEPTPAHIAAVQRFPVILTTNYDRLFEHACEMLNVQYAVRTPKGGAAEAGNAQVTIFKIDGSFDNPNTLVLTPDDARQGRLDRSFWNAVESILMSSRPIVVGHSMRDATSLSLMEGRNRDIKGVYVAPIIDPVDGRLLLDRLNLEGVERSASDYLWSAQI